jgi:3-deoxy-D-manno-octulosonic-acid transferase
VFGPIYDKYIEAVDLVNIGAAYTASDVVELEKIFNQLLHDKAARDQSGQIAQQYIYNKAGATQKIMHYILANRLLTSE